MTEVTQRFTEVIIPQRSDAFMRAELDLRLSKQSSVQLISFSILEFSSAELRFGFHDKPALGGEAAPKRSVVKRNTRPRVKRSITSGEAQRNPEWSEA